MRKHFQAWLLAFVGTACLLTVFGGCWFYRNLQRDNAITILRQIRNGVQRHITQTQKDRQTLQNSNALAKAREFSRHLNNMQPAKLSPAGLEKLQKQLDADYLLIFDEKGICVTSTRKQDIGQDIRQISELSQIGAAFTSPAGNQEKIQWNAENNEKLRTQFAAAERPDKKGFVVVGFGPASLMDPMRLDMEKITGMFRFGRAVIQCEPKDSDSDEPERISIDKSNLSITSGHGKYRFFGSIPLDDIYPFSNHAFRIFIISGLILFAGIFVLTLVLFHTTAVRGVRAVNNALHKINEGDLGIRIKVRSATEFEDLSDGINRTVVRLKKAVDKEAEQENEMGKTIQASILPSDFPDSKSFSLAATLFPAKGPGGDFYDFFRIDGVHTAMFVGDVSDRGIPAALFMLKAKNLLRELARPGCDPAEMLMEVNRKLCAGNKSQMFVSVFFAILNQADGELKYVCAGHPRPLLKHGNEEWSFLPAEKSMVLGVSVKAQYMTEEIHLDGGDRLFIYTNGATETMDPGDKLFGSQRLLMFLNASEGNLSMLMENFHDVLTEFAAGKPQTDDITLMTLDFHENQAENGGTAR